MLQIECTESEYVDDFADSDAIGALARGDVYDGKQGVAFYFARWFAEELGDIELLIVFLPSQRSASQCSLAFRYSKDTQLRPVEPSSVWIDWSTFALPMSVQEATTFHAATYEHAIEIATLILHDDPAIREYVQELMPNP